MRKHYKTLGLNVDADLDQLKKRYRKLALKYHPDVNNGKEARTKFIAINEAYNAILEAKANPKKPASHNADQNKAKMDAQMSFEERLKKAHEYAKKHQEDETRIRNQFAQSKLVRGTKKLAFVYALIALFLILDYSYTYHRVDPFMYKLGRRSVNDVHLKVKHHGQDRQVLIDAPSFFRQGAYIQVKSEISNISGIVHNVELETISGKRFRYSNAWSIYSAIPIIIFALLLPFSLYFVTPKQDFYYGLAYFAAGFPIIVIISATIMYAIWR